MGEVVLGRVFRRIGWSLAALIVLVVAGLAAMVRIEINPEPSVAAERPAQPAAGVVQDAAMASADMQPTGEPAARAAPEPVAISDAPALILPVAGVAAEDLYDSWGDPRGGGERTHTGIDIMAPGGTLVVAAASGTIEKLYLSEGGGGITLYERSEDGKWSYYYAHLGGYAPGITEGMKVQAGDPIAYVGDTGNAGPGNHHLHFGVSAMQSGEGWWQGTAVNPYPLLAKGQSGS